MVDLLTVPYLVQHPLEPGANVYILARLVLVAENLDKGHVVVLRVPLDSVQLDV